MVGPKVSILLYYTGSTHTCTVVVLCTMYEVHLQLAYEVYTVIYSLNCVMVTDWYRYQPVVLVGKS